MSSHITRYKNNKKIAIVKLFLIIIALNRSRYLVNSQTQVPLSFEERGPGGEVPIEVGVSAARKIVQF